MSNLSRNKVRPNPLPSISQLPGPIAVLRGPEANGGITGERRITHQYSVYLNIYKWDCWLKIESLSGMKWDCTKIFRTQWRIFNQQYQEALRDTRDDIERHFFGPICTVHHQSQTKRSVEQQKTIDSNQCWHWLTIYRSKTARFKGSCRDSALSSSKGHHFSGLDGLIGLT